MQPESESQARYARQRGVFPEERRKATAVAILGAHSHPVLGSFAMAGLAGMGVRHLRSDFPGADAGHWIFGRYSELVHKLNPFAEYTAINYVMPGVDIRGMQKENSWIVFLAHDLEYTRYELGELVAAGIRIPTILAVAAPGGGMAVRYPDPAHALEALRESPPDIPGDGIEPGAPEVAEIIGGVVINEVMLGPDRPGENMAEPRILAFYSLSQARRVNVSHASGAFHELISDISRPGRWPRGSFHGLSLGFVGAGALANWAVLPVVCDAPAAMAIHDADIVEASNLNRQLLFVGHVGQPKASALAVELAGLSPGTSFTAMEKFVKHVDDLPLAGVHAVICAPDNDQARLISSDASLRAGVLFACGGTSARGGQAMVCVPPGSCFRCLAGLSGDAGDPAPADAAIRQSCAGENDAVLASNMVIAGIMISELRMALAGQPTANVRFLGNSPAGNRLSRMITRVPTCNHRKAGAVQNQEARA